VDQYVRPRFAAYVGRHFEAAVADLFELFNQYGLLPFVYTRLGSWWHRGGEIDIVCLRADQSNILFCECKWQDDVDGDRILAELRTKASRVSWHNDRREEHFCIVARTFSRRPVEGGRVSCYDLDDLTRIVAEVSGGGSPA
jgi:AAA+ ATPase superfamily predicted ATPase